jgi:hypothetical protein
MAKRLYKMSFRIYVVFHKFLVPECYETLSAEQITKHVRFMAVNAAIQKEVPEALVPYIIQEREQSWYNPFLQYNKFCESSAFFHVWKNPHLMTTPYIGFLHYDMILKKEALDFLEREIATATEPLLFTQATLTARPHLTQIIGIQGWELFVGIYNILFQKNHTLQEIIDTELPLYHSFVIHTTIFHRMMAFAERAIPYMFEMLQFTTKHLPFMLERLHAVFLALDRLDSNTRWIPLPGVIHEDRLKDAWKSAAL